MSIRACRREQNKPAQSDCENVAARCAELADDDAGTPERDAGVQRKSRAQERDGCNTSGVQNGNASPLWLLAAALTAAALRRRRTAL